MTPTLMPVPSAIWLAASAFSKVLASGSISGRAGLLGQTCCAGSSAGLMSPRRLAGRTRAGNTGPGVLASGVRCRSVSGTTARTAGFALSRLTSADEIVAAIALMMWKLLTCVACNWASSASTGAWEALAARTRSRVVAPRAGRFDSWCLKMMIERSVA